MSERRLTSDSTSSELSGPDTPRASDELNSGDRAVNVDTGDEEVEKQWVKVDVGINEGEHRSDTCMTKSLSSWVFVDSTDKKPRKLVAKSAQTKLRYEKFKELVGLSGAQTPVVSKSEANESLEIGTESAPTKQFDFDSKSAESSKAHLPPEGEFDSADFVVTKGKVEEAEYSSDDSLIIMRGGSKIDKQFFENASPEAIEALVRKRRRAQLSTVRKAEVEKPSKTSDNVEEAKCESDDGFEILPKEPEKKS